MKKFVYIYYNNGTRDDVTMEESKAAYGAWFGKLSDKLVDSGNPFSADGKAIAKSGVTAIAGNRATGYSIIKADSLDEAVELAQDCPILDEPEGVVQVYEAMAM